MKNLKYTVVVEDAGPNFSVFVPDLPGCVATGRTVDEAVENIREAIQFHIEGMMEDGLQPPPPTVRSVEVVAEVPG